MLGSAFTHMHMRQRMRNRERETGREKLCSQVYPFTCVHAFVCVCVFAVFACVHALPQSHALFDQTTFNYSNCFALQLILSAIIKSSLSPLFNDSFSIRLILMFL